MKQEIKTLAIRRLKINGVAVIDDERLDYFIDEVVQRVLNFCNLTALPQELHYTVAKIVGELATPDDAKGGIAKVIKVGDTSVEMGGSYMDAQIDRLMNDYQSELYDFRKVRW
ncbi:hypothetical protein NHG32_06920 [Aerococcaceae bacterium NML191219]|nr:hypothetical protein [Aerococcaceae bacterium NML191219]